MRIITLICLCLAVTHARVVINPYVIGPHAVPFVARSYEADANVTLTLTVALHIPKEQVLALQETVRAVSSPSSPDYGNYLTVEQVAMLVAPDPTVADHVESFFLGMRSLWTSANPCVLVLFFLFLCTLQPMEPCKWRAWPRVIP